MNRLLRMRVWGKYAQYSHGRTTYQETETAIG